MWQTRLDAELRRSIRREGLDQDVFTIGVDSPDLAVHQFQAATACLGEEQLDVDASYCRRGISASAKEIETICSIIAVALANGEEVTRRLTRLARHV
jgi:hypothetical protein